MVEVGLNAEGYFSLHLHQEAAADVGEGRGVIPEGLVDGVQDVANLLLEVHVVLYDMQLGVSRPSLEDAGIEVAGLLHGLVARSIVLQGIEFLCPLSRGDHMDDGVVARITELDLRQP